MEEYISRLEEEINCLIDLMEDACTALSERCNHKCATCELGKAVWAAYTLRDKKLNEWEELVGEL